LSCKHEAGVGTEFCASANCAFMYAVSHWVGGWEGGWEFCTTTESERILWRVRCSFCVCKPFAAALVPGGSFESTAFVYWNMNALIALYCAVNSNSITPRSAAAQKRRFWKSFDNCQCALRPGISEPRSAGWNRLAVFIVCNVLIEVKRANESELSEVGRQNVLQCTFNWFYSKRCSVHCQVQNEQNPFSNCCQ